jgi:transcriptional regulator with XRE-family HTH domain
MSVRGSNDGQRRRNLGDFLKARRQQLVRGDLGLPPIGERSKGLRREEVAVLSGVSITWYTWLEQGRKTHPSRQVLDALARSLRLSVAEHAYVLSLAGYSSPHAVGDQIPQVVPAHVLRLLDVLAALPAYVIAQDWQILGWTDTFAALYPNVATVPEADRNLLWLMFTDPYLRKLWPHWELTTGRFLAEFRAEAGPSLNHPSISGVVERLLEASEPFRAAWERHDVGGFGSPQRLVRHPVGDLHLERNRLAFSDHPDLHIVVYTPVRTTDTPARLRQIADVEAPCIISPG